MGAEITLPYAIRHEIANAERGSTTQYVIENPTTGAVQVVYVHASKAGEVKDDQKKKELSFDANHLARFKKVDFASNLQTLSFKPPYVAK